MQPKAINGNSLSVSLKMKQPYKSIGLSHIFSTKPACSLWFPIASHTGKTITNFILNNYIYKLSNLAARFSNRQFLTEPKYADEIENGEFLSPQNTDRPPFNNPIVFFKTSEQIEYYITRISK